MPDVNVAYTRKVGYVYATYCELVTAFGPSDFPTDEDKTQVEWRLQTPAGDAVTIYDYYSEPLQPDTVIRWRIGGHFDSMVQWVHSRLGGVRGDQ